MTTKKEYNNPNYFGSEKYKGLKVEVWYRGANEGYRGYVDVLYMGSLTTISKTTPKAAFSAATQLIDAVKESQ